MQLEEGLYAYLWSDPYQNNCNTYVIRRDLTVLVDPGHSRHLENLFAQMEADKVSPEQIDLLLITHAHPDHFEGVEAFLRKPVRIAMAREEERYFSESGRLLFGAASQDLPGYRIDFYLREGNLSLGKDVFEVLLTPGHSPGSLCLYWPERKVLFTGDVIFKAGIGRTDFLEGNSASLKRSIERLSRLETDLLLPGHGEIVAGRDLVLENDEFIRQRLYPYL
jgi:glyoxylase-like metal-dependent hydrolase (beta-lactamase superfamily II)